MKCSLYILIWILSLIIVQGCGSSKEHQQHAAGEITKSDTASMSNDSMPPPPEPGPAPGQAKVKGEIIGFRENPGTGSFSILTLRIIKIIEYGPSTPPLAVRDSLKIKVPASYGKKKEISFGKIVTAIISYRHVFLGSGEKPRWSLVQLDQE